MMLPSDSAGKNVSAPTMTTTATSSTANVDPLVGKVPELGGTTFLPTIDPAMPSAGMIIKKRPASMSMPSDMLYQGVFALSPAYAEPLLPAPLEYAYRISMRPR